MTSSHLLFIPLVLIAGAVLGFFFGTRVAKDAYNHELRKEKQREAARQAREERKAKRTAAAAGASAASGADGASGANED